MLRGVSHRPRAQHEHPEVDDAHRGERQLRHRRSGGAGRGQLLRQQDRAEPGLHLSVSRQRVALVLMVAMAEVALMMSLLMKAVAVYTCFTWKGALEIRSLLLGWP